MAIIIGDLAHVYADQLMPSADPAVRVRLGRAAARAQRRAAASTCSARREATPIRTRLASIARYKSGKYTIERPLHVGAALAGRLDELADSLSAYGDPLGEAFQLRDDLLGAFGDELATGKPVGDDLREGKPTPLLAAAVERGRRRPGSRPRPGRLRPRSRCCGGDPVGPDRNGRGRRHRIPHRAPRQPGDLLPSR